MKHSEGVTAAAKRVGQNFSVTHPRPATVDPLPILLTASHAPLHGSPSLPLVPRVMFSSTSPEVCAEPLHDELIHHPSPKEAFCSSAPQRCLWWCQGPLSNVLRLGGSLTPSALPKMCWAPWAQAREGGCRAVGDPQLHSSSVQLPPHSWMLSCTSPCSCCTWPFSVGFSFYFSVWFRIALWIWYLASACAWFLLAICLTWAALVQVLLNTLMLQNSKKRVLLSKLHFQAPHTLGAQALVGVWCLWFPLLPVALGGFGWLYNAAPDKAPTPVLGWAAHLVCSHSCKHWGHLCLHTFQGSSPGVPAPEVLSFWEEAALEVWLW